MKTSNVILTFLAAFVPIADTNRVKPYTYPREGDFLIPTIKYLKDPIHDGQILHIVFDTVSWNGRITVNFQHSDKMDKELPIHLSMRMDEDTLVYNYFDGQWKSEQRLTQRIRKSVLFDFRIRFMGKSLEIYNDRYFAGTFSIMMPHNDVDHIIIDGNIAKLRVFHLSGFVQPVPYYRTMRLLPGKRLDITGWTRGGRTDVNIYNVDNDIALQLSIRFNEEAIVRNSFIKRVWGTEERYGGFPLRESSLYDLTIYCEPDGFKIYLNAYFFASFAHRVDASEIEAVEVVGNSEVYIMNLDDMVET